MIIKWDQALKPSACHSQCVYMYLPPTSKTHCPHWPHSTVVLPPSEIMPWASSKHTMTCPALPQEVSLCKKQLTGFANRTISYLLKWTEKTTETS